MQLRTVLIDDEAPARDELRYLIETYHQDTLTIVGEADTTSHAIALVTELKPDLVFLDIQMRGLTGLELAKVIHELSPRTKIIFATAYDAYALQAFELHAVDYVVKPIENDRLAKAIAHVLSLVQEQPNRGTVQSPDIMSSEQATLASSEGSSAPPTNMMPRKIAAEQGGRIFLIDIDSITYITGESGHLDVHTETGLYMVPKTLTELQERFQGTSLHRVHRSFIVNLDKVCEVIPWFKGTYWLKVPDPSVKQAPIAEIPVSKTQVKTIKNLLGIS